MRMIIKLLTVLHGGDTTPGGPLDAILMANGTSGILMAGGTFAILMAGQ